MTRRVPHRVRCEILLALDTRNTDLLPLVAELAPEICRPSQPARLRRKTYLKMTNGVAGVEEQWKEVRL